MCITFLSICSRSQAACRDRHKKISAAALFSGQHNTRKLALVGDSGLCKSTISKRAVTIATHNEKHVSIVKIC
jgi:ABC-type dipeptide/oligopeptide/nickel transport system ATPase subunit